MYWYNIFKWKLFVGCCGIDTYDGEYVSDYDFGNANHISTVLAVEAIISENMDVNDRICMLTSLVPPLDSDYLNSSLRLLRSEAQSSSMTCDISDNLTSMMTRINISMLGNEYIYMAKFYLLSGNV